MSSPSSPEPRGVALLGSTGSIGSQAVEVLAAHPELFRVVALATGSNQEALDEQVTRLRPAVATVGPSDATLVELATRDDVDLVVVATGGIVSLRPVMAALAGGQGRRDRQQGDAGGRRSPRDAGGAAPGRRDRRGSADGSVRQPAGLAPAHRLGALSAVAVPRWANRWRRSPRLILTASGGPFLGAGLDELALVTPDQALRHPTWSMGAKITIDSATLANKGLEVIEAHWLYDVDYDAIEVVIHPQSVVHSAVRFVDGSLKAQMGTPDMRLPIQYAMTYPRPAPLAGLAARPHRRGAPRFPRAGCRAVPCAPHRPRRGDRRPVGIGRIDRRRRRRRRAVPRGVTRLPRHPAAARGRGRALRCRTAASRTSTR